MILQELHTPCLRLFSKVQAFIIPTALHLSPEILAKPRTSSVSAGQIQMGSTEKPRTYGTQESGIRPHQACRVTSEPDWNDLGKLWMSQVQTMLLPDTFYHHVRSRVCKISPSLDGESMWISQQRKYGAVKPPKSIRNLWEPQKRAPK